MSKKQFLKLEISALSIIAMLSGIASLGNTGAPIKSQALAKCNLPGTLGRIQRELESEFTFLHLDSGDSPITLSSLKKGIPTRRLSDKPLLARRAGDVPWKLSKVDMPYKFPAGLRKVDKRVQKQLSQLQDAMKSLSSQSEKTQVLDYTWKIKQIWEAERKWFLDKWENLKLIDDPKSFALAKADEFSKYEDQLIILRRSNGSADYRSLDPVTLHKKVSKIQRQQSQILAEVHLAAEKFGQVPRDPGTLRQWASIFCGGAVGTCLFLVGAGPEASLTAGMAVTTAGYSGQKALIFREYKNHVLEAFYNQLVRKTPHRLGDLTIEQSKKAIKSPPKMKKLPHTFKRIDELTP